MSDKLRVIITGATGMVGEGVLHECLHHPDVEAILVISRKPVSMTHAKLKVILHEDFYDLLSIEQELKGYNACFFCLGISSVGMKEADYFKVTYALTMHMASMLSRINPGMTFCYISGASTDSTEKGRSMWARVKGKTENDLMKLPFKAVYAFRPGFIKPISGLKHINKFYKYINWMFPIGRTLFPRGFCRLTELAAAMIKAARVGYHKKILEGDDIIQLGTK